MCQAVCSVFHIHCFLLSLGQISKLYCIPIFQVGKIKQRLVEYLRKMAEPWFRPTRVPHPLLVSFIL